jgi:Uma2 family endonuclease
MISEVLGKQPISLHQKEQQYWDLTKTYTFDEYFELEENAPFKSEFRDGKIYPMSNGTNEHGLIAGSLYFYLKAAIKSQKLNALVCTSEVKVYLKQLEEGIYPDCFIIIGERQNHKKNKAVTNPSIVFEVLSNSTGNYDRGDKFRKYKLLPSFQEYVLIEQDQPAIDVLHKKENGVWEIHSFMGLDDVMELNTLDVKIKLSDIYEDIENLSLPQYKMDLE